MTDITLSPLLSSSASAGFLVVESGSLAGQRFPLPQPPGTLLMGRERMCNVRFDPERDRVVGRAHARIEVRADGIYLVDLNSANGTFRQDGSAVRGEIRLSSGERFQLGGEGGPWLYLQGGAAPVAVHVAPPAADMPTLITRPAAPPAAPHKPWEHPLPPGAAMNNPGPPAAIAPANPPVVLKEPMASPSFAAEAPQAQSPEPKRAANLAAAKVDATVLEQQKAYRRQIAVITVLLLLACSVGLALGLRDVPVEREAESTQAE